MSLRYSDKPWVKQYDKGVPATIEVPTHPVQHFLEEGARRIPTNPAMVFQGGEISYRELNEAADAVAAALAANGFKKGDRAVLYMPNLPQFVVIYYGILKAGGIVIATTPLYTERELQHQLKDCGAETVFVLSRYYPLLKKVQKSGETKVKRIIVTYIKDYLPGIKSVLYGLLKAVSYTHLDVYKRQIQMVNSVILGSANNCGGGLFDSLGHNISRGTCPALAAASDRENYSGDLRLGPLMFNGGAPEMHTLLPLAGSPLINAADAARCTAHDQRGRARVGVCDIGAVEYEVGGAFRLYLPLATR